MKNPICLEKDKDVTSTHHVNITALCLVCLHQYCTMTMYSQPGKSIFLITKINIQELVMSNWADLCRRLPIKPIHINVNG